MLYNLTAVCLSIPFRAAAAVTRHAAARNSAGSNRGKRVIHLQLRVFGRVFTVGRDRLWKARGLGWFRGHSSAAGKAYHARSVVLWVEQAAKGASRFELEYGRLSVTF
jgi:hypothetical protein